MDAQKSLAYLLIYAANIDAHIDAEEKHMIKSKLDSKEEWKEIKHMFENDTESQRVEKITTMIENASEDQKNAWLLEVKNLMNADGEFSSAENQLIKLLGHF